MADEAKPTEPVKPVKPVKEAPKVTPVVTPPAMTQTEAEIAAGKAKVAEYKARGALRKKAQAAEAAQEEVHKPAGEMRASGARLPSAPSVNSV